MKKDTIIYYDELSYDDGTGCATFESKQVLVPAFACEPYSAMCHEFFM